MFDLTITMEQHGGLCKLGSLDARIICTDLSGDEPIVLAVEDDDGAEFVLTRALDGSALNDGVWITTLPETKVIYAYVHLDGEVTDSHASIGECQKTYSDLGGTGGIIKMTITDDYLASVERVAL